VSNSRLQQLLMELRRRRVFRVATLYVVSMWPLIQILDILSPALNISNQTMSNVLFYFAAGFPIAVGLAWLYNLTPQGFVKNSDADTQSEGRLIGKKTELALVVLIMSFAIVVFSFQDYWFDIVETNEPAANVALQAEDNVQSIAVLPFVPFSEDKQDEFFADGLAEELLNVLAKVKSLRVAARTSSFEYKGVQRNIQKIGRDLGVDVILEGSVRRNDIDNTVRVTAQLIDVRSGSHIWSETYDRQFSDIFKIQDEITQSVVSELKITLLGDEKQQLLTHETANTDAVVAHARGRAELAKRTASSISQAKGYFQQAIERDANYATAYASLAESNVLLIEYAGAKRDENLKLAQQAVDASLKIDPQLGLAWAAQGLIHYASKGKTDEAKAALVKAIELNPSYAMAYMWYGSLHDEFSETIRLYKKAYQLDPKSSVAGYNLAINLTISGNDEEAVEVFKKMVETDPFYHGSYVVAGMLNIFSGRLDQAIVNYKRSYDLGDVSKSAMTLTELYTDLGMVTEAKQWLSISAENKKSKSFDLIWAEIAILFNAGQMDKAKQLITDIALSKDKEAGAVMSRITANYALNNYAKTIASFEKAKDISKTWKKEMFQERWLMNLIYTAHAYRKLERNEDTDDLLEYIDDTYQEHVKLGYREGPNHWYLKALIEAVSGNKEKVLPGVQIAIEKGWLEPWRLEFEPILADYRALPEFNDLRQSLQTRANILKEQLTFDRRFTVL